MTQQPPHFDDVPSGPAMPDGDFRAGFVAILGKPNAGKSTLLNALLGEKVAAVSPRPQTTRTRLTGIHSDDRSQFVFVDLPGIVEANDPLNTALRDNLLEGMEGTDVLLHLVDAYDREPVTADIAAILASVRVPAILAVNKLDGKHEGKDPEKLAEKWPEPFAAERYAAVVGISALQREGLPRLLDVIRPFLPQGPPLYDTEEFVDAHIRDLAGEMIREKAFLILRDEVPYAVAVEIDEFTEREPPQKTLIRATIHVERDSQKGILIGEGGSVLKRISTAAREDIEPLCGNGVFLELWVKVRRNWRKNENDLRMFGLASGKKKRR